MDLKPIELNTIRSDRYQRWEWSVAHPVGFLRPATGDWRHLVYVTTEYDRQILRLFKTASLEGRDLLKNPVLRLAMWIDHGVKFQTETRQCGYKYPILNSNKDFWENSKDGKDIVCFMCDKPSNLAVLLAYELLVSLEQGRIQALYALYKAYKKGVLVSKFKDEWLHGTPIPLSVFNWKSHPAGMYARNMYYDLATGTKAKRMIEDE